MIKKIVIAIVCFAAIGANAQDGTVSPYSYFGIGDLRAATTIDNQMMGGLGMYADSIHVNLQNPAAYGKLRLTAYSAGISYQQLSLASASVTESNRIVNLDYVALGFNLGKGMGVGFGIMPYTSVGYNIVSESIANNTDGTTSAVSNQYSGTGGLNKVYLSLGYEITKDLSLGVTANFNFGTIDALRTQIIEDVQFGTLDNRTSRINGMDFNYALNYTPTLKDKFKLYSSVRINTQANLSTRNTQEIGSFSRASGANIEIIDVNLEANGLKETGLKIPTRTTLGLGLGEDKKWFLGAEYSFQDLSSFSNDFINVDNLSYQEANTIAVGGFFIPDYTSFESYLKRVTYRAGVRMENTGMVVNNTEINNFGITFGVGLPLASGAGGFSNINLGFEIGKRGTTEMMLIEENYFKINIGLSLNDRWFLKRKIN
ncbi:hypothetical protein FEE95_08625 [Maribacter algarum]|uniref:Long-chain fatty acid transport protein n=1 Tax=Maribacter algarum (ex Zhang et al. 2020) TaxID=2578118 RepID=A0A5S3PX02_9FLAO|nr:hypothetical protein [Maribacter algarum]TMM59471.1 hypothetical protein FEE95_08625 [Maribacter algarum]